MKAVKDTIANKDKQFEELCSLHTRYHRENRIKSTAQTASDLKLVELNLLAFSLSWRAIEKAIGVKPILKIGRTS